MIFSMGKLKDFSSQLTDYIHPQNNPPQQWKPLLETGCLKWNSKQTKTFGNQKYSSLKPTLYGNALLVIYKGAEYLKSKIQ